MTLILKRFILNFIKRLGYRIKKIPAFKIKIDYKNLLYVILSNLNKKKYKIIQIGSNDGKKGDPINSFIEEYHNSISYLGFEPQEIPFNKLKKRYQNFKNFYFIKNCIGEKKKSRFYYLNKNFEELCKKKNINFSDVESSLLEKNLKKKIILLGLNPKDYIENYEVLITPLKESIKKENKSLIKNFKNIDLLQIDCEGYDDKVIYNSSIEFFSPAIINFEYVNLSKKKLKNLIKFLNNKSYKCIKWSKSDCIAIKK